MRNAIDHFHYDVTRAKVSGSCSKDRAQCRAIAGKCLKISRSAMSAKVSYQGVSQSYVPVCYTNSKKFSVELLMSFFSINEELRSVVNEHFNGKPFSQILDTECVAGKRVLTNTISLMRKRIEGEKGVSEMGDIEQLEQFLNNSQMEIEAIRILYLA